MSNGSGHLLHVTEPFIPGGHLYEVLEGFPILLRTVTFAAFNIGYANSLIRTGEFLEITPCPVICLQSGKDLCGIANSSVSSATGSKTCATASRPALVIFFRAMRLRMRSLFI